MANKQPKLKLKIHFGKLSAILIAVFALLLTADLVTKYCEEAYNWNFTVIPKFIWVESGLRNTGAAFSFLADTEWGRIFFIVLTFLMLVLMIALFLLLSDRFWGYKIALVMIAAGALGNLIDRLALQSVRDFVWMNIFGTDACCNFADFWIVLGAVFAVFDTLFLNDYAVFPLTKQAKASSKARAEKEAEKEREKAQRDLNATPSELPEEQSSSQDDGQPTDGEPNGGQPTDGVHKDGEE